MRPSTCAAALLCAVACAALGCSGYSTSVPDYGVQRQLDDLRANTARYLTPDAGAAAGWNAVVTDCMTDPALGGMGVHYADTARFDTTLDAQRPELLVYEPQGGALRLVAAEYAVPLAAWTRSEPPTLLGQRFHVNSEFGLWVLHAWVQKPNPSGVFADWNPNVACPPPPA